MTTFFFEVPSTRKIKKLTMATIQDAVLVATVATGEVTQLVAVEDTEDGVTSLYPEGLKAIEEGRLKIINGKLSTL